MRLHAAESNVLTTADDGLRLGEGAEFVAKREGAVKRGPEAGGTITAMEETRGMGGKPSSGVTGNLSFE